MAPESILTLTISGVMLILSAVTFIVNSARNAKRDTVEVEARYNEINTALIKANLKLDQVCTATADIRTEVRTMQNKQIEHTEQIARLEQSVNTAFVRIDELKEQINTLRDK